VDGKWYETKEEHSLAAFWFIMRSVTSNWR
jgi:hypothetical protein